MQLQHLKITSALLLVLLVWAPLSQFMLPIDSAFYVDSYSSTLWGKYLCLAILAVSLDFIWGRMGILSLGQAAFFALGGYAMGMYLMRQIGTRGVYGDPLLPDFMVFLNWTELPWFWLGFDNPVYTLLMVFLVPGALAFVFGFFAFRSRVSGVYLSIITQALTYALMLAFFRNELGLGGNNGLTDFKDIFGLPITGDGTRIGLFMASGFLLLTVLWLCYGMTQTKFGRVMTAIRDAESRTRFLGYRVEHYKVAAFTLSAMIAGAAGALYVPQVGIINPGEFSPLTSIEVVVWVALGGRGSLYGAALGAIVVNLAKTFFTGYFPDLWLFFLGGMFIFTTLFLPKGLIGLIDQVRPTLAKCGREATA